MTSNLDWWIFYSGVAIMAWGQFGIPADTTATFALGIGLALRGMIHAWLEIHSLVQKHRRR